MHYEPGQRVRVVQQIPRQSGTLTTMVEGTIVSAAKQKTGSWYAHSLDHKLWLDRLEIRKDDGEIVFINLDRYSHVDLLVEDQAAEA